MASVAANPPKTPKRYGWHRRYNHADRDPKWRRAANRAEARLVEVLCVKNYLDDCAASVRKKGFIGDFVIEECAVALDIDAQTVARVVRVLVDLEWLSRSHVIVDWLDRQPDQEDATAADRQRNKRRRDEARTRAAIGLASDEDLELLSKPEREALEKLASMSRVTAVPAPPPRSPPVAAFVLVRPLQDTHEARELAAEDNARNARRWLLGDGSTLASYGPASKIVADNFGCNRINADANVRRWLQELSGDAVTLAQIISSAEEQAINDEAFRAVVEQRIAEAVRARTVGAPLPFPPQAVGGRGA